MASMTVGKYVPGDSIVHRTNPRLKLAINIILIVLVFITKSVIILGSIVGLSILIFLASRLKTRQLYRMLIPVAFIGIFLFLINTFLLKEGYASGNKVDYTSLGGGFFWSDIHWWKLTISDKAVFQTIFIMMRIYIMILITTLLTATTKPTALTKAIEDLLLPLKLLFIPVHIIAMIISIALRFIPTLLEEAQRIMKAQASRGVDFKNGGIKSKAKSMVTLIIPLFVSAFAKAEDLGNAMETRGYNPYEKRTRYRTYPVRLIDVIIGLFVIGMIVVIALLYNNVIVTPNWWV